MKLIPSSVKIRLLLALGGISGTTVLAAGVACVLFGQFGSSLNEVTGRSVPAMTASLELAAQTQSLAASAPALLAATNDDERTRRLDVLRKSLSAGGERIEQIKRSGGNAAAVEALSLAMSKLTSQVDDLNNAVVRRLAVRTTITKKVAELDKAHQSLLQLTAPALENAKTQISMASMSIGGDAKEMTNTLIKLAAQLAPVSLALSDIMSDANLVSALMHRADTAPDVAAVQSLKTQFGKASGQFQEQLDGLENLDPSIKLRDASTALLTLGSGKDNFFELRSDELEASAMAQGLLDDARGVINDLDGQVGKLVETSRQDAATAEGHAETAIHTGTVVVIVVAAAGVVAALLVVTLYVGRNVLRRLLALCEAMRRLANGDLDAEVPDDASSDEIAEMGHTLAIFKQNAVEARRLAAEQAVEQQEKEKRHQTVEGYIHDFEGSIGQILETV